jgi:hypothetical protein
MHVKLSIYKHEGGGKKININAYIPITQTHTPRKHTRSFSLTHSHTHSLTRTLSHTHLNLSGDLDSFTDEVTNDVSVTHNNVV